jgi:hypothetical protein
MNNVGLNGMYCLILCFVVYRGSENKCIVWGLKLCTVCCDVK